MAMHYLNPEDSPNPHKLPDLHVVELTSEEIVELGHDEDMIYAMRKRFPMMGMNGRDRAKAIDWAIDTYCIAPAFYFYFGAPGCLPDSDAIGPFESEKLALEYARATYGEDA